MLRRMWVYADQAREIGLRITLGATRQQVLRTILRDAIWLAVPGLAPGALLTVGVNVAMGSLLYGLSPLDPISFLLAAAVLFLVVILASLVPALRAANIDPMANPEE